jgi:hypothetical protein
VTCRLTGLGDSDSDSVVRTRRPASRHRRRARRCADSESRLSRARRVAAVTDSDGRPPLTRTVGRVPSQGSGYAGRRVAMVYIYIYIYIYISFYREVGTKSRDGLTLSWTSLSPSLLGQAGSAGGRPGGPAGDIARRVVVDNSRARRSWARRSRCTCKL